jgi:glycosyltransferase involved in cell wall biosynthesis
VADLSISVVIPTYNRARFIARAVASVLVAIAPDDEVIVVDDDSSDDTARVLSRFRGQIRYIRAPHGGVGAARNRGIRAATRPLVAFQDSDDEWFADKLCLQRALMAARPDVLFCFTDFWVRREDGRPDTRHALYHWHHDPRGWTAMLGPGVPYSTFAPLPPGRADFQVHIGSFYLTMLRINYVSSPSAVVRREAAGDALRFAEDISIHEDHECFIRLSRRGLAAYLDCETFWNWGHAGARLSAVDDSYWATCRLKVLARTYGADPEFLAQHGDRYHQMLAAEHLTLARGLIMQGRLREAREELRLAGGGPLGYRALTVFPRPCVRGILSVRRAVRNLVTHGIHTPQESA